MDCLVSTLSGSGPLGASHRDGSGARVPVVGPLSLASASRRASVRLCSSVKDLLFSMGSCSGSTGSGFEDCFRCSSRASASKSSFPSPLAIRGIWLPSFLPDESESPYFLALRRWSMKELLYSVGGGCTVSLEAADEPVDEPVSV